MSRFTVLITALLLVGCAPGATGHAYLVEPPSRNLVAHWAGAETCPHCLQSGGPTNVRERAQGMWPTKDAPNSHGLCGNPVQGKANPVSLADESYLVQGEVQRTYTAGEIATFRIGVSTHHMGHYEFRICDRGLDRDTLETWQEGQDCLNEWLLERAPPLDDCVPNDSRGDCQPLDQDHPERWYLPPAHFGTQVADESWSDSDASPLPAASEVHVMRYKIPEGLSCEHCTLQWYYSTGNSCMYDGGYFTYFNRMAEQGWSASDWVLHGLAPWASCANSCCGPNGNGGFGEEFWNCADIAVAGAGAGPSPTPAPAPAPVPAPVPMPPSPAPEPEPEPEVTTVAPTTTQDSAGSCSGSWQQCGGRDWSGPTCCNAGHTCVASNEWHSQCQPAPTTTAQGGGSGGGACAEKWGQCGGNNHDGPACCSQGFVCTFQSEWYSQCAPPPSMLQALRGGAAAKRRLGSKAGRV